METTEWWIFWVTHEIFQSELRNVESTPIHQRKSDPFDGVSAEMKTINALYPYIVSCMRIVVHTAVHLTI